MDPKKISIVSAVLASSCCLPPLIMLALTLVGASSVGFAGVSGTLAGLKWYLMPLVLLGLGLSYYFYLKEKRKCASASCGMVNEKLTKTTLIASTIFVVMFLGLSFSQFIFPSSVARTPQNFSPGIARAVLNVDGMTCATCAIAVDRALHKAGAQQVTVSVTDRKAVFGYDPQEGSVDRFVEAVNKVGYRASVQEVR